MATPTADVLSPVPDEEEADFESEVDICKTETFVTVMAATGCPSPTDSLADRVTLTVPDSSAMKEKLVGVRELTTTRIHSSVLAVLGVSSTAAAGRYSVGDTSRQSAHKLQRHGFMMTAL